MGSGADNMPRCVVCNVVLREENNGLCDHHNIVAETKTSQEIREYKTGATRDSDEGKFVYNGFNCPLVEERFAAYMHHHRHQSDGELRAADNWKKGIPSQDFLESLHRHFIDVWKIMEGYEARDDLESALCAMRFNVNGLLRNVIKGE